ncbi:hypothetical protein GBAR_LOCUS5599, partial [Geodia barretti]
QVKCISWCIRGSEAGVLFEESHEAALRIHKPPGWFFEMSSWYFKEALSTACSMS